MLPELAEHRETDPGEAALARFLGWFAGGATRVHVLLAGECHAIAGEADADGFHGGWRRRVSVDGDVREVSEMSFSVTRHGVHESGPGGTTYLRDERGRWQESGRFGTGFAATLVEPLLSAADERALTFAGYRYGLTPVCGQTEVADQTCSDGGARRCQRCTRVTLVQQAAGVGRSVPRVSIRLREPTPVDCSQPCPADEWTPRLPRLAAALAGRTFHGARAGARPVVFRSAKGCARERRRGAAGRRAEDGG